jgi:hypothetical protein
MPRFFGVFFPLTDENVANVHINIHYTFKTKENRAFIYHMMLEISPKSRCE